MVNINYYNKGRLDAIYGPTYIPEMNKQQQQEYEKGYRDGRTEVMKNTFESFQKNQR